MNTKEMREALFRYYETEGPDRAVELVRQMSDEEVVNNYKKLLEEETFEKARERLDEETVQKEFDLDKGRRKIT
jgi:nitrogen regulatory protein PII-like uncharacterized protein